MSIRSIYWSVIFLLLSSISIGQINTNISNSNLFGGEPYLTINPLNDQNLIAAWMDVTFLNGGFVMSIKTKASFDAGDTWSPTIIQPHIAPGYGSADPSMVFNSSGILYLSYVDYRQAPDSGGIYVLRSTDGGLNWDAPSFAFDMYDDPTERPIDRPWLVIDNSGGPGDGNLYITTKPAPWIGVPNTNYYKVSMDGGFTWSTIGNVEGPNYLVGNTISAPLAAPAVTSDGKFVAAYPSYVASQNVLPAFYLATSVDQGQSFTYQTIYTALPASSNQNFKKGYQLITDPSDAGKMALLSIDADNGDADISCRSSNDGGASWNSVNRINDDAIGNGKAQDMVWGSYNETGDLVVTWRDRRNSTANDFWNAGYDFYYAVSPDNGLTFGQNQKISSQFIPFDSLLAESGNDFMSNVFRADTLYTVWGDTRNGKMQIYFSKIIASSNTSIGLSELNKSKLDWTVSPNPTSDFLIFRFEENSNRKISLLDALGKLVWHGTSTESEFKLEIGRYKKGVYTVVVDSEYMNVVFEN